MNKPSRSFPRPLSEFLGATLSDSLKTQGFASTEIIARWADIAGTEIAAHSEPMKITWPRANTTGDMDDGVPEPATLVLRVEGPAALEIQHLLAVILERVNRFFGWQAIGRISLRQAPLRRRERPMPPPPPEPAVAARIAEGLPEIKDEGLRQALALILDFRQAFGDAGGDRRIGRRRRHRPLAAAQRRLAQRNPADGLPAEEAVDPFQDHRQQMLDFERRRALDPQH